ncbi:hypothetical protein [Nonomuraea sp. NPDC050643]|uniref:hypothetical protein n=1 Tax=Nonomuraea sp. NPDC050643 TaxID=3155660 RepID=UPI0033D6CCD7
MRKGKPVTGFSRPRRGSAGATGVVVLSSLAIASALTLTGCGVTAEADDGPKNGGGASRTYTVEQLAATIGCTAEITLKALDYRKGECTSDGIPYVFLDFQTEQGQREWLDYAEMYGGLYLVGDRWALSAKSKSFMQELSAKIGGTVEEHDTGASAPPPGAG